MTYMTDMLVGNENIKKIIKNIYSFQTILIEGAKGSGKDLLKDLLIKIFLCESDDKRPCEKCKTCKKNNLHMHTDVVTLDAAEPLKDFKFDLRSVNEFPNDGKKKIYVIDKAQQLTIKHQNALLKLLEEPPEFVVFILMCDTKESLLKTVVSRATVLTLMPLKDVWVYDYLKTNFPEKDDEILKAAVRESGGYIGPAISACGKKKSIITEKYYEFLVALSEKDIVKALSLLSYDNKKRDEYKLFIDRLSYGFKDLLVISSKADFEKKLSPAEKKILAMGTKKLMRICDALQKTRESLVLNPNINLWGVYIVKECGL